MKTAVGSSPESITTAEELWNKYECLMPEEQVDDDGLTTGKILTREQRGADCIVYDDFFKALTEDRQQIKDIIDEIKDKYCLDKWFTKDDINDILTEIKEKL